MRHTDVYTVAEMLGGLDREDRGLTFLGGPEPVLVTFSKVEAVTADLARRWAGLGVQQGDRVVLVVADEREFVITFLSALRAGVVAVPMFPPFLLGQLDAYYTALRRICEVSGPARCLVSQPLLGLLGNRNAGLECPVSVFEDLVAAAPGAVGSPAPGDPALLQFSSGSTGDPKGAVITHRSLLANAHAIGRHGLRLDGEVDRAVSWLPLYHDMGLIGCLIVPVLEQVATSYLSPLRFARDPMSWPRLISEVGATMSFAPNFAYGLVTRRVTDEVLAELDLSRWRVAGCGAEPVRADTLRAFAGAFAAAGFRASSLMPSYGLAEATLAVALTPCDAGITTLTVDADVLSAEGRVALIDSGDAGATELVSCGPPVHGMQVRVLDQAGNVCAEGGEGELVVRGESLADGYFGDPDRSAQTWRDGWLHTGDTGFLYEGRLYVTGRIKDLIVVNGRNHQPQDIEWAASHVPGVQAGNVVALPVAGDHTEGVRLVLEASQGAIAEDLAQQVRQAVNRRFGLSVHDVVVLPREGLPKTSSGKLRRSHTASLLDSGLLVGRG